MYEVKYVEIVICYVNSYFFIQKRIIYIIYKDIKKRTRA